ncbi:MAG: hypothetical protein WCH43_00580 [Verrucomicrobiota bacterium]
MNHSRKFWQSIPLIGVLIALAFLGSGLTVGAEESSSSEAGSSAAPAPGAQGAGSQEGAATAQPLPPRVFGEPVAQVPYSTIFRNTDITATSIRVQPTVTPTINADPFNFQSDFGATGAGLKVPFLQQGFEPQNSTFKLGPVFIKIWRVQGGVLVSDNINLTETDRKAGAIAFMRMDTGVTLQLGEGFQLAVAGSIVYLPIQGKIGPAGYGLDSVLGLGIGPVFTSQLTYDTVIGGWNVQFYDEVTSGLVYYSNDTGNNFVMFQGAEFPWVDRAGVYAFGAPYNNTQRHTNSDFRFNTTSDQQYLSNKVGVQTTHLLPSDIRLSVNAYHQNFWYNQDSRGLPSARDVAELTAVSERENLRFKPYLSTSVSWEHPDDTVYETSLLGFIGPVTDQLELNAAMGYFINSNGYQDMLWRLNLSHTAGPNTRENLNFGRGVNTFGQEMSTWLSYTISQTLGPSLTGQLIAMGAKVEDLTGGGNSYNDFLTGVQLTYIVSPRTEIRATGTYQRQNYTFYDQFLNVWTGRLELSYHISDTLIAEILYQYQNRSSDIPNNGYYENMVTLSISKFFP